MRYNSISVRRPLTALLPLAVLLALGLPAAAGAKDEPGVHVDPGSPAGKEYVIPLEGARREASGAGGGSTDASGGGGGGDAGPAPLFGAGIKAAKKGSGSGKGEHKAAKRDGKSRTGLESTAQASLSSASAAGSSDSALESGAIGLAVLIAGGGLGLLLRRGLLGWGLGRPGRDVVEPPGRSAPIPASVARALEPAGAQTGDHRARDMPLRLADELKSPDEVLALGVVEAGHEQHA